MMYRYEYSVKREKKGFAMSLFVVTLIVLGMVSSSLVYNSVIETISSRNVVSKESARLTAVSAIDDFYSHISSDRCFLNVALDLSSGSSTNNSCRIQSGVAYTLSDVNPLYLGLVKYNEFKTNHISSDWVHLDGGKTNKCENTPGDPAQYKLNCFIITTLKLKRNCPASTSCDLAVAAAGAIVQVIVRNGCYGSSFRCIYTSYSQIIKQSQFSDYLYYLYNNTGSTTLPARVPPGFHSYFDGQGSGPVYDTYSPSRYLTCSNYDCYAAYTASDIIDGDIYTNRPLFICASNPGSVTPSGLADFKQKIRTTLPRTNWYLDANIRDNSACTPISTSQANLSSVLGNQKEFSPTTNTIDISTAPNSCVINKPSNASTTISFSPGADGVTNVYVDNSLSCANKNIIYVKGGPVFVGSGTSDSIISGAYSLLADDNIYITTNILYKKGSPRDPSNNTSVNPSDILSITSKNGDIILEQVQQVANCPSCYFKELYINAQLQSISGGIYTDNWYCDQINYTNNDCGNLSLASNFNSSNMKLYLYGSIASKYQPVFGAYDGSTSPSLISGFKKDFKFDDRLLRNAVAQPPFALSSNQFTWKRLALAEIPTPK